jgi:glycosyltransferase involved in cell wall biosynthesis
MPPIELRASAWRLADAKSRYYPAHPATSSAVHGAAGPLTASHVMSRNVVVVTNIPRPYRLALFERIGTQLAAEDLELQIIYTSDPAKHVRRSSVLPSPGGTLAGTFARSLTLRRGYENVVSVPIRLGRLLQDRHPACVVTGGFGLTALLSTHWCRRARVPHLLWSGAWSGQEGEIPWLHRMARKWLVRNSTAFISYGTAAADYLTDLGAPQERVFRAWNTVDLEGIASAGRAAAARRSELTPKYGLAATNLLFVGSLVPRKGVRELVAAATAASPCASDWALHFAGDGPLRKELQETVRLAGREANFRFHGLMPAGDVAELLGLADGFLLPTKREAWGLVVNEAMACGVPVVVSPAAGATRDLISDGVTGYVVEPTDIDGLTAAICRLLSGDLECKAVGQAGAAAVRAKASLDRTAAAFVSGVLCALGDGQNE